MRIAIAGASGFIGRHLSREFLNKGHEVTAFVRNPERMRQNFPEIKVIKVDFLSDHEAIDWICRIEDIDVVINAVGIIVESRAHTFDALHTHAPIALFQACEVVGVKRVIQISALGADENAFSHFHRSKLSADRYLRESSLDWAIVMPSVVYGQGAKSMALFKAIAALPLIPLIDAGDQQIQPIHVSDLAKAIVELVESPFELRQNIEMVGPDPVTIKNLYLMLRQWFGLGKARFISIPYWLVLRSSRLLGSVVETSLSTESVQMLRNGNTSDVEPFIERFGFKPKGIQEVLTNTQVQQSDLWHAGLYFLAPALRISIAFLWLFTGYVSFFVFPVDQSYALLGQVGIKSIWQPIMLYGAAVTDLLIGIATFLSFRMHLVVLLQIVVISIYSFIITIWLPEYWIHPFGPVTKNLPLLVAILVMLIMERRT